MAGFLRLQSAELGKQHVSRAELHGWMFRCRKEMSQTWTDHFRQSGRQEVVDLLAQFPCYDEIVGQGWIVGIGSR